MQGPSKRSNASTSKTKRKIEQKLRFVGIEQWLQKRKTNILKNKWRKNIYKIICNIDE